MRLPPERQRLLVISPVRNERAHIERVAAAVAAQTRPPDSWVIVDDGSTDGTRAVLTDLAAKIPYLTVLDVPPSARPVPAARDRLAVAAEARAFNFALRSTLWRCFTHIAKLDGDIELPPRYFERLLAEFSRDQSLGLAGGVYADPAPARSRSRWRVIRIPLEHHVPGALKCWSQQCFEEIGGVQERLGWDTMDETYARMAGYRTRALPDLVALHHRPWGSADGTMRGRARHGQCAYAARFPLPWVALRSLKVARHRPVGLSGIAFLYGYLRAAARSAPRVEDDAFARFVRRELRGRMLAAIPLYSRTSASDSSQQLPDQVVTAPLR